MATGDIVRALRKDIGGRMDIQWYPGHMTKAVRTMADDIKLVDLVVEIIDARIPLSSRNPDIDRLAKGKARILLLNKADLADEAENTHWIQRFARDGISSITIDSRNRATFKGFEKLIEEACREKTEKDLKKGIKNRPLRAMVTGIPNVGKSTFINSFAKKAAAKTGNTPGVTKGKQWIRLSKTLELLDTPGILWPKFEDETVGRNLALTGAIREEVLPLEELAVYGAEVIKEQYPGVLAQRFGVDESKNGLEIIEEAGRNRGCLLKGNQVSFEKAAKLFLTEFKNGKLGRITIEKA